MVDPWKVVPGDVIQRRRGGAWDNPLMVLACHPDQQGGFGVMLRVFGIIMMHTGNVLLRNIIIDSMEVHDYEWVVRCKSTVTECTVET